MVAINAWSVVSDAINREAFSEIVPGLPESIVRIAIGGVNSPRNVFLCFAGADAVLVGEAIMAAQDPAAAARSWWRRANTLRVPRARWTRRRHIGQTV